MDLYGISMADFASHNLSMFADLPVVHQTGLTGQYDMHFGLLAVR